MTRRIGVLALSAATGYVSLSQEILWMRAVSYMTGGRPTVFAHILGAFLVGVALGALSGERLCERRASSGSRILARFTAVMLVVSAVVYYLSIPVTLMIVNVSERLGDISIFAAVMIVSFTLGGIFPVLCHYAAREGEAAGITVSRIYLANIAGSTLGPLLTGFVLMQYLTTDRIILYLSLATLLLGVIAFPSESPRGVIGRVLLVTCLAGLMLAAYHPLYRDLLERLQFKGAYAIKGSYKYRLENRSGIIAVSAGEPGRPDIIYGGGVYDGRFNTDPVSNWNGITRAYMIAALHLEPREVLEVGLSSASWTRVMANYSPIRKLTVVEINPGYKEVIARYPELSSVLHDPKVTIVIDDGRRWLNRNSAARFDIIVQNTTYHWRSNVTNLLSEEYLRLCKKHLNAGGVLYYNATSSEHVPFTAAQVFAHVTQYGNFVAASDSPFSLRPEQVRANLLKFNAHGKPFFAANDPSIQRLLGELSNTEFSDKGTQLRAERGRWRITDDNMATEFKQERWHVSEWSWAAFLKRRWAQASRQVR